MRYLLIILFFFGCTKYVSEPKTELYELRSGELRTDFYGNPIVGLPDIGAIEYLGGYVPPPPPPPVIYYNSTVSGTAQRNNCPVGFTGSTVTYLVPYGKYSSTISQAVVDEVALNDLNLNKQAYANINGICTQIITYYSKQVSGVAIKNNCPPSYVGSAVTYTVTAGKYTSVISQADADLKAVNDLNTNKQTYANLNGVCVKKGKKK